MNKAIIHILFDECDFVIGSPPPPVPPHCKLKGSFILLQIANMCVGMCVFVCVYASVGTIIDYNR